MHVLESGKHAIDSMRSPGRRPIGVTQVFQDQQRWIGGVGGDHRRQERRLQRLIQIDLCVKPLRGACIGGALCEGRATLWLISSSMVRDKGRRDHDTIARLACGDLGGADSFAQTPFYI